MKIIIKGEAKTEYSNLKELDGIDCQDCFSYYFSGERCKSFKDDITGGYMDFRFEGGKLMTYTEYESTRKLTEDEESKLISYTQGQWSDGIGEGFEQTPCKEIDGEEVYISPWFFGQVATLEYED